MKRTGPSDLKAHVGFWLRLVSNHVSHAFARKLEQSGVTVAEWVVLREMLEFEGATSPGEIARRTGLTRGAISRLIDRLLGKNLVTREESATDRRYQDIALTRAARALVPKLAALADWNDAEFFSSLTKSERAALVTTLQKIARERGLKQMPID